jgi:enediyne polyketide synthase
MKKNLKSVSSKIAVVGLACRYPDADTPTDLFTNSISQRRSFRKIPEQRLSSAYFDTNGNHPDKAYVQQAAVLKNFEFDRAKFKVPLSSYQNTDMTHWLALTVAAEAIQDIQFRKNQFELDNESVRVVVGNTLTGEFSRSNMMRLRWPYVKSVVEKQLQASSLGLSDKALRKWLQELEHSYKLPFPVPNADSLAGGLGNTIAGRICNHFDFKGGGYTIDGACSSSLLAVTDACSALISADADVVLAGGVDLSIDPFELIGFSRTAALAKHEMRVFDKFSQGFWPGEGCGFVVLMRYEDAIKNCSRIYGVINGWGVSSDGQGGLTRPEVDGQKLALKRSYERAGYGIETVTYFEGHGTGTEVGDTTELTALISSREEAGKSIHKAVISSIKANIGHTKAASGLASLIRTLKCLEGGVLPPTTACIEPHSIFSTYPDNLMPTKKATAWDPVGVPRRAGVSAMGFGGINTHITVEEFDCNVAPSEPGCQQELDWDKMGNIQNAELFLFSYSSPQDLSWTIDYVAEFAGQCSLAEFTDLAAELTRRSTGRALSVWRAATVAKTPKELVSKLRQISRFMETFEGGLHVDKDAGFSISGGVNDAKVCFLFPGQGSVIRAHGGGMERRFEEVRSLFAQSHLTKFQTTDNTDYGQVAITMANLAGQKVLQNLGIVADMAVGHSLGELSALCWAKCISQSDLISMVFARGAAMVNENAGTSGAMVAVAMSSEQVRGSFAGIPDLFVANINSEQQTVVSGSKKSIKKLMVQLKLNNVSFTELNIKQAFHSPVMHKSASLFKESLEGITFSKPQGSVVSTVTGHSIDGAVDLASHLQEQITNPVLFQSAIETAAKDADLFIEIGPGSVLTNLTQQICNKPALAIDVGNTSLEPFLNAVGAIFVAKWAPGIKALFEDRDFKRFEWGVEARYLANQCELYKLDTEFEDEGELEIADSVNNEVEIISDGNVLESLRTAVAAQVGLPKWTIQNDNRMLADLHLNSIAVSKIVADVARSFGLPALLDPTQFSNSSIDEIYIGLKELLELKSQHPDNHQQGFVHGVSSWVRYFSVCHQPATAIPTNREVNPGVWRVAFAGNNREQYESIVARTPGKGTLLVLDDASIDDYSQLLLRTAQRCIKEWLADLVVIQFSPIAGGFLKSFSLENPTVKVMLFTIQGELEEKMAVSITKRLTIMPAGFSEFKVGQDCKHEIPVWRNIPKSNASPDFPIDENDLVLISGGGKGISAECGYQLALNTGCALLIIGRSHVVSDDELARNIKRLNQAKLRATYFPADVTDKAAIESAIANALDNWGMSHVAGIIHGAGINHPNLVGNLNFTDIQDTWSPKIDGFNNLIACIDPHKLKLLATFSSIIGRMGLHGEADYALANERLSLETELFQKKYPHVLCRALEWSIWSGTGMGHSMGRVDVLFEQGIAPITIEDGITEFLHLLSCRTYPTSLIVTSRFSRSDMIGLPHHDLTQFRFIDTIEIEYPGIELVAQCHLHPKTDLYLSDHVLEGALLFPAAMVLEVFAEAINTLLAASGPENKFVFKDVNFAKAIIVPYTDEGLTLRVAILVEQDNNISCVLRCSDTGFQINHVQATCVLNTEDSPKPVSTGEPFGNKDLLPDFDVTKALYSNILFQKGRFKRVGGYRHVEASGCSAQLTASKGTRWFDDSVEGAFLLGDPGVRDSVLHGVQACMPHKTLIPVSVARVEVGRLLSDVPYQVTATELEDNGDELIFDLCVSDKQGEMIEKWHWVVFRKMSMVKGLRLEAPVLLAPLLERYIKPLIPGVDLIVQMLHGESMNNIKSTIYRPDGKPSPLLGDNFTSNAYSRGWRLSASSNFPVACDLEWLTDYKANNWSQLLGKDRFSLAQAVSELVGEDIERAAARVWTVFEAIKKVGIAAYTPITLDPSSGLHCITFRASTAYVYCALAEPGGDAVVIASIAVIPTGAKNDRPKGSAILSYDTEDSVSQKE